MPSDWTAFYEDAAGFTVPEWSIAAYRDIALKNGAELYENAEVIDWAVADGQVHVKTQDGRLFTADKLVITAGARASEICKVKELKIRPSR